VFGGLRCVASEVYSIVLKCDTFSVSAASTYSTLFTKTILMSRSFVVAKDRAV
jgi:hypothetical protein